MRDLEGFGGAAVFVSVEPQEIASLDIYGRGLRNGATREIVSTILEVNVLKSTPRVSLETYVEGRIVEIAAVPIDTRVGEINPRSCVDGAPLLWAVGDRHEEAVGLPLEEGNVDLGSRGARRRPHTACS